MGCNYSGQKQYELNFDDLNLNCPICEHKYSETIIIPKNLPCGHTICQECINRIHNQQTSLLMKCPFDRIEFEFQNFPTSYTILQTIDSLKKKEDEAVKRGRQSNPSENPFIVNEKQSTEENNFNEEQLFHNRKAQNLPKMPGNQIIFDVSVIEKNQKDISNISIHSALNDVGVPASVRVKNDLSFSFDKENI